MPNQSGNAGSNSNPPEDWDSSQRAQERATAGLVALEVLHEIKNPLEALGHLTYLALQDADDPEKVRLYMRLAEEQVATLNHVASQTLGFAKGSVSPESIDLTGLAEAAIRIHQRTMESKNIHLVRRLPDALSAQVHKGEILQVLSNLIVNALEALPAEGTIHIRLRKANNEIHLVVADNGPGIPHEHMDKVFRPFFTTKQGTGTGLGLALSKRIVDHHRGKIRLRSSVRPGRSGTMFKITLPC